MALRRRIPSSSSRRAWTEGGGTVTRVELEHRSGVQRVRVFLGEEYSFSLAPDVASGLQEGQELDEATIRKLFAREERQRAYEHALQFLAPRPRSIGEIRRRLTLRGYPPDAIDPAIHRLQRAGLADDQAFAAYWVGQRKRFHPRGNRILRAELRTKGVDADTAAEAIGPSSDQEDDAYRAGLKHSRRFASLDERTFAQTMGPYLLRRGFDYGTVRGAVRRLWLERDG
ncbi:MAG: regulatory protein RecX [Chloroflexi bacterium]|nr:regulatory protein RecX [Chloroflexota bacterium]